MASRRGFRSAPTLACPTGLDRSTTSAAFESKNVEKAVELAEICRDYVDLLTCPFVALVAIIMYRGIIRSLLPGAKVQLRIAGVTVETTLPKVEASISESLQGEKLSEAQWDWLKRLHAEGRIEISEQDRRLLRPLRDSGLVRAFPRGFLQNATAVEITTLGRLLVESKSRNST